MVLCETDQWSPVNPEGKKAYDRTFLLELQHNPASQKKPDGLPNLEVVRDKVNTCLDFTVVIAYENDDNNRRADIILIDECRLSDSQLGMLSAILSR